MTTQKIASQYQITERKQWRNKYRVGETDVIYERSEFDGSIKGEPGWELVTVGYRVINAHTGITLFDCETETEAQQWIEGHPPQHHWRPVALNC